MERNSFVKMHGLGNDYIVLDSELIDFDLTPEAIRRVCDVHYGIGSDGIVLKVPSSKGDFGFRVYNPDGSEAEKSGNGLRIFCKFIFDYGYTKNRTFSVETLTDTVHAEIVKETNGKVSQVKIDMGKAVFASRLIPVNSDEPEFISKKIIAGGREFEVNCVSVGNPHCVIIKNKLDDDEIMKYGPLLETHELFPNKINVQFARVVSGDEAEIIIWERGAGYTLASGSSSCAVASVLVKRGLTGRNLKIKMKGGTLYINIDADWNIRMTGEVREIARGVLSPELIEDIRNNS